MVHRIASDEELAALDKAVSVRVRRRNRLDGFMAILALASVWGVLIWAIGDTILKAGR